MHQAEIIERLNELLATERAGVHLANQLAQGLGPEHELFEDVKLLARDEAWCCAGLFGAVLQAHGQPRKEPNEFAAEPMAAETLKERFNRLEHEQARVVTQLNELLAAEGLDTKFGAFLLEMRSVHVENGKKCRRLRRKC